MEYQKIINLLDNTPSKSSKFRAQNWVKIKDDSRGTYNIKSQIKIQILMLKSSICDYRYVYILVSGTITFAALWVIRTL